MCSHFQMDYAWGGGFQLVNYIWLGIFNSNLGVVVIIMLCNLITSGMQCGIFLIARGKLYTLRSATMVEGVAVSLCADITF